MASERQAKFKKSLTLPPNLPRVVKLRNLCKSEPPNSQGFGENANIERIRRRLKNSGITFNKKLNKYYIGDGILKYYCGRVATTFTSGVCSITASTVRLYENQDILDLQNYDFSTAMEIIFNPDIDSFLVIMGNDACIVIKRGARCVIKLPALVISSKEATVKNKGYQQLILPSGGHLLLHSLNYNPILFKTKVEPLPPQEPMERSLLDDCQEELNILSKNYYYDVLKDLYGIERETVGARFTLPSEENRNETHDGSRYSLINTLTLSASTGNLLKEEKDCLMEHVRARKRSYMFDTASCSSLSSSEPSSELISECTSYSDEYETNPLQEQIINRKSEWYSFDNPQPQLASRLEEVDFIRSNPFLMKIVKCLPNLSKDIFNVEIWLDAYELETEISPTIYGSNRELSLFNNSEVFVSKLKEFTSQSSRCSHMTQNTKDRSLISSLLSKSQHCQPSTTSKASTLTLRSCLDSTSELLNPSNMFDDINSEKLPSLLSHSLDSESLNEETKTLSLANETTNNSIQTTQNKEELVKEEEEISPNSRTKTTKFNTTLFIFIFALLACITWVTYTFFDEIYCGWNRMLEKYFTTFPNSSLSS